jgi:flagellar hook protein FlgE
MAFQIDPSILNAASLRLSVIGNNISNSGVTGYQGSDFSDVLASSATGGGNGVRIQGSRQLFTQGTIQTSVNSLDMAINGQGFYKLYRPNDGSFAFTRDGSFNLDKDGNVTNPSGDILQGYGVDASGNVSVGKVMDLRVSTANAPPKATSTAKMSLLLDSRLTTPTVSPFDPTNAKTYTSTTISTVYDQLGSSHTLQSYYVKTGPDAWNLYTSMDGIQSNQLVTPAIPGVPAVGTPGNQGYIPAIPGTPASTAYYPVSSLSFGQAGTLNGYGTWAQAVPGNPPTTPTLTQVPTGANISLNINYTDSSVLASAPPNASFNLDISAAQQYASDFLASTQQNGFPTGQFQGITVGKDGTLNANYSSGDSRIVGEVVLATFPSSTGLAADRNNQFVETSASGAPIINTPGKGGAGQILGSSVETSNVDLTAQMIKLISAQRTYQANSEVVKRQDQIMQTIIGIGQ